jgi:hypothetical protein
VGHAPAEVACGELARRDDPGGVAGARRGDVGLERDAGGVRHGRHDLAHGHAVARAEVVDGFEGAALAERAGGCDVRVGEVGDVDVVADAGAVGRGIVVAKNGHAIALS